MEYYEDEDEQFGYNDVSGDDLKKKILSLGISAYSGGNDAPGNLLAASTLTFTHSLIDFLTHSLIDSLTHSLID